MIRNAIQLCRQVGRTEVDPSDDTFDEVGLFGEFEQPQRLLHRVAGLHSNRSVESVRGEQRL